MFLMTLPIEHNVFCRDFMCLILRICDKKERENIVLDGSGQRNYITLYYMCTYVYDVHFKSHPIQITLLFDLFMFKTIFDFTEMESASSGKHFATLLNISFYWISHSGNLSKCMDNFLKRK